MAVLWRAAAESTSSWRRTGPDPPGELRRRRRRPHPRATAVETGCSGQSAGRNGPLSQGGAAGRALQPLLIHPATLGQPASSTPASPSRLRHGGSHDGSSARVRARSPSGSRRRPSGQRLRHTSTTRRTRRSERLKMRVPPAPPLTRSSRRRAARHRSTSTSSTPRCRPRWSKTRRTARIISTTKLYEVQKNAA